MASKIKNWAKNPTELVVDMEAAKKNRDRVAKEAIARQPAPPIYCWSAGPTKVHVLRKGPRTLCGIGKRKASAFGSKSRIFPSEREFCGVCRLKLNGKKLKKQAPKPDFSKVLAPEFLLSYQWRKLRYEVLLHYKSRCMACGRTPQQGALICVDHIKPRRTHPERALDFDNLQVLCEECNHGKGNWDQTDWRNP